MGGCGQRNSMMHRRTQCADAGEDGDCGMLKGASLALGKNSHCVARRAGVGDWLVGRLKKSWEFSALGTTTRAQEY